MALAKNSQGMEAVAARRPLSGKHCARQMGHEEMPISFRPKTRDGDEMDYICWGHSGVKPNPIQLCKILCACLHLPTSSL